MKDKLGFTFILLFYAGICLGQQRVTDIGLEFQAYPTGLIPGLHLEHGFSAKKVGTLRLGYQIIDHGSRGKHSVETGNGFGGSIGLKHYLKDDFKWLSFGIRTDIWANKIDWLTILDKQPAEIKGTTHILVLQLTVEAGWGFIFWEKIVFTPTVAFGFEINVKTEGEPTGEGAIVLLGVNLAYRIQ